LPDGLFPNQKSQFGQILVGFAKENLGIFYDNLFSLTAIGNILWPLGIFCGSLVYFSPFWYFGPKNLATLDLRRVTSVVVQDVGENKISFALTSGPT
jgi:hypothetical protein